MKVAVTPLTRKYAQGKFRFFTLINVIPDVVAAAAGHANWSFSRLPLILLLLLAASRLHDLHGVHVAVHSCFRAFVRSYVRSVLAVSSSSRSVVVEVKLKINFPRMAD